MKTKLSKIFSLDENNILYIFSYGSRVYGTYSEVSDYDYIIVCKDNSIENQYAVHNGIYQANIYQESLFDKNVLDHKPYAIECMYLSDQFVHANQYTNFKINLQKLRSAFSEKANHSWVKAKKKFEIENDFLIAKKSIFHSLRIIDFGIQLAENNKINYSNSNYLWDEIKYAPNDWNYYNSKYKLFFNSQMSKFRSLAPIK